MPVNRQLIVQQALQSLRREIAHGTWVEFLPAERRLATVLGIGRTTLRKILSQLCEDGVIDHGQSGKRRRILSTPLPVASSTNRLQVIWLAPESFSTMPQNALRVITYLKQLLLQHHIELIPRTIPKRCLTSPDKYLPEWFSEQSTKIWILHSLPAPVRQWFSNTESFALAAGAVHKNEPLHSINIDINAAGRVATRKLLERGHRSIALIHTASNKTADIQLAETFIQDVSAQQGTAIATSELRESIPTAMEKLYSRPSPPTAIIVDNPRKAISLVTWLQHHGYQIPQDVSIILLRSQPIMNFCLPQLSYFAYPEHQVGELFTQWITHFISGGSPEVQHISISPEWIGGDSLAPPPHQ